MRLILDNGHHYNVTRNSVARVLVSGVVTNPLRPGTTNHKILDMMLAGKTRKQIANTIGRPFNLCSIEKMANVTIVSQRNRLGTTYHVSYRR